MTRTPDTARLPPEVEIVRGDLTVPANLDEASRDVDTVFLLWTAPAAAVASAIERIATHARRVVFLSSPHNVPHPFFQQPNPVATMHADIERTIRASGLRWTFLRPGMFAGNTLLWWGAQIRAGNIVRWPYGDAASAPIDVRDVAEVAAIALTDTSHDGGDYVLTGPDSVTHREQVATIGDVIGKPLRFDEMTPDEVRSEWHAPPAVVNMLLSAWTAAVGLPAYVTNAVAEITGRPARTFREWAGDHAAEFLA
jgi:uncharacterized protein YbjT (DUF2867 family)